MCAFLSIKHPHCIRTYMILDGIFFAKTSGNHIACYNTILLLYFRIVCWLGMCVLCCVFECVFYLCQCTSKYSWVTDILSSIQYQLVSCYYQSLAHNIHFKSYICLWMRTNTHIINSLSVASRSTIHWNVSLFLIRWKFLPLTWLYPYYDWKNQLRNQQMSKMIWLNENENVTLNSPILWL